MASVTFKGNPVTLTGNEVKAGQAAPDFTTQKVDMSNYTLNTSAGKTRILLAVSPPIPGMRYRNAPLIRRQRSCRTSDCVRQHGSPPSHAETLVRRSQRR
jgi:hypothetical protein